MTFIANLLLSAGDKNHQPTVSNPNNCVSDIPES
jgi:hypothetical protein